jgi:hypothetical protein
MLSLKIKRSVLFSLIVGLTACSSTKEFYYKTGQLVQVTTCEGGSWSGCYHKAGETCQAKGYEVIERASYKTSGVFSSTDTKELVYQCKDKPAVTK